MSYLKHNIKRKKKAKGRVRKRGKEGRKKEAQCVHISLAWRFAEVCTPLEPAVSLANDTSGASGEWRPSCAWLSHFQHQVFWDTQAGTMRHIIPRAHRALSLCLSLASSLLSNRLHSSPLSCCCCTSAYADILCLTLVLPLSFFLPPILSLFLFDLVRLISSVEGKKGGEKMRAQERGKIFLLTCSLYVKSRGFFLSPILSLRLLLG